MARGAKLAALVVLTATTLGSWSDDFAKAYNTWKALVRVTPVGTISYPEIQAWQRTKDEWRKLEKRMDSYYRGER